MDRIQVGDRVPDFTSPLQTGEQVSLAKFRSSKAVVLFFYPKDDKAVSTKEACRLRDAYEDLAQAPGCGSTTGGKLNVGLISRLQRSGP